MFREAKPRGAFFSLEGWPTVLLEYNAFALCGKGVTGFSPWIRIAKIRRDSGVDVIGEELDARGLMKSSNKRARNTAFSMLGTTERGKRRKLMMENATVDRIRRV